MVISRKKTIKEQLVNSPFNIFHLIYKMFKTITDDLYFLIEVLTSEDIQLLSWVILRFDDVSFVSKLNKTSRNQFLGRKTI